MHYWEYLAEKDIVSRRSHAAQVVMMGAPPTLSGSASPSRSPSSAFKSEGITLLSQYADTLGKRFLSVVNNKNNTAAAFQNESERSHPSHSLFTTHAIHSFLSPFSHHPLLYPCSESTSGAKHFTNITQSNATEGSDEALLALLLSEAQVMKPIHL